MCYDAIIFNNGGILTKPTLLEIQQKTVRRAFDEFDMESTAETADGIINGGLTRLRRIYTIHDVPIDDLWPHHGIHATAAQQTCLENGTKPLYDGVAAFDDIGHPLVVVSSNQHTTVEHIPDVFDIGNHSEVAYGHDPTAEGTRVKRPDPHYIECAMGKLDVDSVPYAGDSSVDMVAADRAGIDSAFTRRPHRDGYQLAAEPTYELDLLDELLAVR